MKQQTGVFTIGTLATLFMIESVEGFQTKMGAPVSCPAGEVCKGLKQMPYPDILGVCLYHQISCTGVVEQTSWYNKASM